MSDCGLTLVAEGVLALGDGPVELHGALNREQRLLPGVVVHPRDVLGQPSSSGGGAKDDFCEAPAGGSEGQFLVRGSRSP